MTRPELTAFSPMGEMFVQQYERYLPTAFDESMTLLQKVNKVIQYLNEIGKVTNDVITKWNEVMLWIMAEGLNEKVSERLTEMVTDGTFENLINQEVFGGFNTRLTTAENDIDGLQASMILESGKNVRKDSVFVDIRDYGALLNGVDDTTAFINATTKALANNIPVYIPKGVCTINASVVGAREIASMIGEGSSKSVLKILGLSAMQIKDAFRLEKIKIESDYTVASGIASIGSLFYGVTPLQSLRILDVVYQNISGVTTGATRGSTLIRCHASNVRVKDVVIEGSRFGMIISKSVGIPCDNLSFDQVTFKNVQTGLYITNGGVIAPTIEPAITNLSLNNITLINTETQRTNYSQINGADMIMLERVDNVKASNLYIERAVERSCYFNYCKNVIVDNVILVNTEGLKFAGYVDIQSGIYRYGDGFKVNNVLMQGGNSAQVRGFIVYDVLNGDIGNVTVNGEDTTSLINHMIELNRYVENLVIHDVRAKHILRGVIHFNARKDVSFSNRFKEITIRNVEGFDVVEATTYDAINVYIDPVIGLEETIFDGLYIYDCYFKSGISPYYQSASLMSGMISLKQINKFRSKGNVVEGFSRATGWLSIQIPASDIKVDETIYSQFPYYPTGNYFSGGSVIEHIGVDESNVATLRNKITVLSQQSYFTSSLVNINHQGEFMFAGTLDVGEQIRLPFDANTESAKGGFTSADGWMDFLLMNETVSKNLGSSNSSNIDQPNCICVYGSHASGFYLKNNLSQDLRVEISLRYLNRG